MKGIIRSRRTETTSIAAEEYFHIDEKSNAVDYLHRAAQFSRETITDDFAWKWFMISLHSALYNFMLLAIQRTDLSGIWVEPEICTPDGYVDDNKNKLVSFLQAYQRIQEDRRMHPFVNSRTFQAEERHNSAVRQLNDKLRNEFMHFHPKGWSIQKAYMAEIVPPIIEIIDFLISRSGNIHLDEEDVQQVTSDIERLRSITV